MIGPEELLERFRCAPVLPEDEDGDMIEELRGTYLKPLGVEDVLKISEYQKINGPEKGYQMVFVRGVVALKEGAKEGSPDPDDYIQVMPDEYAEKIGGAKDGPIERAVERIRLISGRLSEDEKKTPLRNGKT